MKQQLSNMANGRDTGKAVVRAATVLAVSAALAGCSGMDLGRMGNVSGEKNAAKASEKASKAMAKGDLAKALLMAEAAVAANPNNANYRLTLAQAYMAQGRFVSAETSFADALALGNDDGRGAIGLSLAMLANSKEGEAISILGEHRDNMAPADYGLALALAGDPETAIQVLDPLVRQPEATPRMRQNLAFSYAVAGRWLEAKIIAAQDMNPANLEKRMATWSMMISSSTPQQRIAGMLGVTPNAQDAGQPERLALNPVAAEGVAMANAADAVDGDANAPAENLVQIAQVSPAIMAAPVDATESAAPMQMAAVPAFTPEAQIPASADAPLIASDGIAYKSVPVVQPLRVSMAPVRTKSASKAVPKMAAKPMATKIAVKPMAAKALISQPAPAKMAVKSGSSNWVVQMGAYESLGVAQTKWGALSRQFSSLNGLVGKGTNATVNGKNFVRLSASGFANQKEAIALCNAVKAKGGSCLVRQMGATETVRWASKGGNETVKVAARAVKKPVRVASR